MRYSKKIDGDKGNYNWPATFDLNGKYLGISQVQDGAVDRVLLSPKQTKELLAFLDKCGHQQSAGEQK